MQTINLKYNITDNFRRVGLHDSHISEIKFEKGCISMKLDWGFMESFVEENILESIVFGEAQLMFSNIQTQTYKKLIDTESIEIERPQSIENAEWLVMTNEFVNQDDFSTFVFTITNDFREYVEWTINFKECQLTWDKFILHKNWLSGQETI